tara:strand:- start:4416 stop:4796 length:381 start_codon:yes stop_codon:yes gene_type:complete
VTLKGEIMPPNEPIFKVEGRDPNYFIHYYSSRYENGNEPVPIRIYPNELKNIGHYNFLYAIELFDYCGAIRDFCVQCLFEPDGACFGGVNRVTWNLYRGWKNCNISTYHCTKEFIEKAEEYINSME